eukprot:4793096-Lingulodinium_polyedra.AAC.1
MTGRSGCQSVSTWPSSRTHAAIRKSSPIVSSSGCNGCQASPRPAWSVTSAIPAKTYNTRHV